MSRKLLGALIGFALIALLLRGSIHPSANQSSLLPVRLRDAGAAALNGLGNAVASRGNYAEARDHFLQAAVLAERSGDLRAAAMNWSNVATCENIMQQFHAGMGHFIHARRIAEQAHELRPLIFILAGMASHYVLSGQPDNALRVAREAMDGPAGHADERMRNALQCQIAVALAEKGQLDEAGRTFTLCIERYKQMGIYQDAARELANWGVENVNAKRYEAAEKPLRESLDIVHSHHLRGPTALALTSLGRVMAARGNNAEASKYFESAMAVTEDRVPRWRIVSDRAQFRLDGGDLEGARNDFREVRRLVTQMKADMVPADQARVAFDNGIARYLSGLVEAGNRIALRKSSPAAIEETFNAAEEDRLWSLRSILPSEGDWRERLPAAYWEKLSVYQAMQRRNLAGSSSEPELVATRIALEGMEAAAGGASTDHATTPSALRHAQSQLDDDSVLLAFRIADAGCWAWVVDRHSARVVQLPPASEIRAAVAANSSPAASRSLYSVVFGRLPADALRHPKWLVEPDGPLHDVAFPMLHDGNRYLVEKAQIQILPAVSLLRPRPFPESATFAAIGDAVYNAADQRVTGRKGKPEYSLPRLPGATEELQECARTWGESQSRVLTGVEANADGLDRLLRQKPGILHFATHVVAGTGEYRSGLLALSLNPKGAMDLLGPREIIARAAPVDLVVLNGCHSGQAQVVASSGQMGLTRAWLAAGAQSVVATRWDIPDRESRALITAFYRALRAHPTDGPAAALRQAQLEILNQNPGNPSRWGGYYIVSRSL